MMNVSMKRGFALGAAVAAVLSTLAGVAENETTAIQAAIDAAAERGGGQLQQRLCRRESRWGGRTHHA